VSSLAGAAAFDWSLVGQLHEQTLIPPFGAFLTAFQLNMRGEVVGLKTRIVVLITGVAIGQAQTP
jgi:hypothetical protein